RVAKEVESPQDPQKSFGVLTNANGDVFFVAFDGVDHKHAKTFTPVPQQAIPDELRAWYESHLGPNAAASVRLPRLDASSHEALVEQMVTRQIANSGTARRSEEFRRTVTDNLTAMNRYSLKLIDTKLTVDDLEMLNALATRGNAHYGEDIESLRGVARG